MIILKPTGTYSSGANIQVQDGTTWTSQDY